MKHQLSGALIAYLCNEVSLFYDKKRGAIQMIIICCSFSYTLFFYYFSFFSFFIINVQ